MLSSRLTVRGPGLDLSVADRVDAFVAGPVGRCVLGPSFLTWCATPDLHGAILWGTVDDLALRGLMAAGRFIQHPDLARRRRVLVDCREVTRVDADVLLGFPSLARDRLPVWTATVERQAIVVPSGLAGLLLGGALPSVGASQPMRFSHDLESALAFVDHPLARDAHHAATHASLAHRGRAALVTRLRAYLGRDLTHPTVDGAARSLGMSARSLQRELARLATSFRDELRQSRVTAAEALLLHSDLKIEAVAQRVGLGTASRMSATLRRELDVTASGLRARARR